MSPSLWFLVTGVLAVSVSRYIRARRQQLDLRRGLATGGAAAASATPSAAVGVLDSV